MRSSVHVVAAGCILSHCLHGGQAPVSLWIPFLENFRLGEQGSGKSDRGSQPTWLLRALCTQGGGSFQKVHLCSRREHLCDRKAWSLHYKRGLQNGNQGGHETRLLTRQQGMLPSV